MKITLLALASGMLAASVSPAREIAPTTMLATSLAVEIAEMAVGRCAVDGYEVSAAVTDTSGVLLALVRSEYAGPHTVNASKRKAFTSASYRTSTRAMVDGAVESRGIAIRADAPGLLVLAGGVPINAGTATIGAIGVAGAPAASLDDECANAAVEAAGTRLM